MQLIRLFVVFLIREVVLLGPRQLMQRFEQLLILREAAPRLIHTRRKGALLLLGLLEVDLCDFYPALLRLIIGQTVEALLLLLA